ncbi:MAG: hypothetical protein ACOC8B_01285 [Gemmatimonadota bacterium]
MTFTLTPTSTGTHLTLARSGFGPDQRRNFAGAHGELASASSSMPRGPPSAVCRRATSTDFREEIAWTVSPRSSNVTGCSAPRPQA